MKNNEQENPQAVTVLINKSALAEKSEDAMRFSQAACNAANALAVLRNLRS